MKRLSCPESQLDSSGFRVCNPSPVCQQQCVLLPVSIHVLGHVQALQSTDHGDQRPETLAGLELTDICLPLLLSLECQDYRHIPCPAQKSTLKEE